MKIFKGPNTDVEFICPVCGTGEIEPVTLVGLSGTEADGNMQAVQVHVRCLKLVIAVDEETGKKVMFHAGEIN